MEREKRRRRIFKFVELYFDPDEVYDRCPPEEVDHESRERLHARILDYLLDEQDADLKDEALYEMFERMCERHPEPRQPTVEDILFVARVTGCSPNQGKDREGNGS